MTLFGGHDLAGSLIRVAPLDEGEDDFRAGVLPARIADGNEVSITADAQAVQHVPGLVEQGMVGMGWRQGHLLGHLAFPPPTPLCEQRFPVREAPPLSALALAVNVSCAPGAEVVRGTKPQATVGLAHLLATTLRVSRPVTGFALAGPPTTGVGVVTRAGPRLMDAQTKAVGELTSAGLASLFRHNLRRCLALHGRIPVGRPLRKDVALREPPGTLGSVSNGQRTTRA